ncbi:hypothetical protein [Nocardia sp. NPDC047038]|uniref:hypothetical protein n=1 Tax=Nocardia sp. NPDC047038 TaxID=3154338 RepID=UPI0033C7872D
MPRLVMIGIEVRTTRPIEHVAVDSVRLPAGDPRPSIVARRYSAAVSVFSGAIPWFDVGRSWTYDTATVPTTNPPLAALDSPVGGEALPLSRVIRGRTRTGRR